jgi:hypothetical protein
MVTLLTYLCGVYVPEGVRIFGRGFAPAPDKGLCKPLTPQWLKPLDPRGALPQGLKPPNPLPPLRGVRGRLACPCLQTPFPLHLGVSYVANVLP